LKNWLWEFDMMCSPSYQIGLFGSSLFVGFTLCGILL